MWEPAGIFYPYKEENILSPRPQVSNLVSIRTNISIETNLRNIFVLILFVQFDDYGKIETA